MPSVNGPQVVQCFRPLVPLSPMVRDGQVIVLAGSANEVGMKTKDESLAGQYFHPGQKSRLTMAYAWNSMHTLSINTSFAPRIK